MGLRNWNTCIHQRLSETTSTNVCQRTDAGVTPRLSDRHLEDTFSIREKSKWGEASAPVFTLQANAETSCARAGLFAPVPGDVRLVLETLCGAIGSNKALTR
jgi:hypothetical protein